MDPTRIEGNCGHDTKGCVGQDKQQTTVERNEIAIYVQLEGMPHDSQSPLDLTKGDGNLVHWMVLRPQNE